MLKPSLTFSQVSTVSQIHHKQANSGVNCALVRKDICITVGFISTVCHQVIRSVLNLYLALKTVPWAFNLTKCWYHQTQSAVTLKCVCLPVCVSVYLTVSFHLLVKHRWWSGTTEDSQREKHVFITQRMEHSMHFSLHLPRRVEFIVQSTFATMQHFKIPMLYK